MTLSWPALLSTGRNWFRTRVRAAGAIINSLTLPPLGLNGIVKRNDQVLEGSLLASCQSCLYALSAPYLFVVLCVSDNLPSSSTVFYYMTDRRDEGGIAVLNFG